MFVSDPIYKRVSVSARRVFGNMTGAGISDEDEEEDALENELMSDDEKNLILEERDDDKADISSGDDF